MGKQLCTGGLGEDDGSRGEGNLHQIIPKQARISIQGRKKERDKEVRENGTR